MKTAPLSLHFCGQNSAGGLRIWCKQHDSMDPSWPVLAVQDAAAVRVWDEIFFAHFEPFSNNWAWFKDPQGLKITSSQALDQSEDLSPTEHR